MNEIPMGPPPAAKYSVLESEEDFLTWLDEGIAAEERAEDEESSS